MGSGCTKSGPESVPGELASEGAAEEITAVQVEGKKGEAEDGKNKHAAQAAGADLSQ